MDSHWRVVSFKESYEFRWKLEELVAYAVGGVSERYAAFFLA